MAITHTDPATIEIIRNRLLSAAEDMRTTLVRSAYTPTIFESEDCAIGLLDSNAEVIALSTGLPIFLGNLGQAVEASVALRGGPETMRPGEVYLLNDPYIQGAHLQDCTSFAPIFSDGQLIGYSVARAHMVDLGSILPGGGMASTNVYHEGLRLGPVLIFDADGRPTDMIDVLKRNSRSPEELIGDVHAMAAAVSMGAARLQEIAERWGVEVLNNTRDAIFAFSEKSTRAAITAIPDGVYTAEGSMDDDGVVIGKPVTISVQITVDGDSLHVNFAGTSPFVQGAINCGIAQTISSTRVALRLLLGGDRPPDGGTFRTVSVSVPEGSFLNAQEPVACGNYAASAVLLMDLVMRALADALPQVVCAGQYGDTISEFVWMDGKSGKPQFLGEAHAGGWGAGEGHHGADAVIDLTNGRFRNFSAELLENRYPMIVEEYGYRPESGGDGAFKGGRGIIRRYRLLKEAILHLWMDRLSTPPWGLAGGDPGVTGYAIIRRGDSEQTLFKCDGLELEAGTEVTIMTTGGGGFGVPSRNLAPQEDIPSLVAELQETR